MAFTPQTTFTTTDPKGIKVGHVVHEVDLADGTGAYLTHEVKKVHQVVANVATTTKSVRVWYVDRKNPVSYPLGSQFKITRDSTPDEIAEREFTAREMTAQRLRTAVETDPQVALDAIVEKFKSKMTGNNPADAIRSYSDDVCEAQGIAWCWAHVRRILEVSEERSIEDIRDIVWAVLITVAQIKKDALAAVRYGSRSTSPWSNVTADYVMGGKVKWLEDWNVMGAQSLAKHWDIVVDEKEI